ncbi:FAD-dependent oxidoreductase [Nocardioides gilvus]|uniref:FAD-dependent oxidoreductase n=1 Tax=Nocardioides gilvus TaxID=1735589 RepID=UPI000D74A22B|nr:FAD-dependent oxidoreductase [Nocardioides gilvus]
MALTSLWETGHTPRAERAEVRDGHWEVAVVGGGITGLAAAVLLARAGRSVALFEGRRLGAGSTGRSTAKLSLLQGTRLSEIARLHSSSVLRDYVSANRAGQAWVREFCADSGVELQTRSAYTYANTTVGERRLREELSAATVGGLHPQWLDEVGLPFATQGAIRLDDQLQVDPLDLVDALAAEALTLGVQIFEEARVTGVGITAPYRLQIDADGGAGEGADADAVDVTADRVVLATNLPILDRGAFFARASPARSYALAFRTPALAVDGMYLSADEPSRSLRDSPSPQGPVLLVGGNGHRTGAKVSEQSRIDELRDWTHQHFPGAEETHAWSAQDQVPHRGLPYAGPVLPATSGILAAGGFAKWGMTNGVAAAIALVGEMVGAPPRWSGVYRSWTPRELRSAHKLAAANLKVGLELAEGWLRPLVGAGGATGQEGYVSREGAHLVATSAVDGHTERVSAVCTHLGGVVRWNDAERSWDCPLHGSRFAPDGSVLEAPATCGLRKA